jgi:mono/diheme cytochrome c family protein
MNRGSFWIKATMVTALTAFPLTAAQAAPAAKAPAKVEAQASHLERGKYLVTIMGCNDCHTPWKMAARGPEPDMSRMLMGHPESEVVTANPKLDGPWMAAVSHTMTAWTGPWGVSFTANLTPDPDTGLGKWTAETFIAALRTGKHEGVGRPILPPMPYPFISKATDDDLRAIFAYLQSIPPIKNRVPQPIDPPEPK